MGERRLRETEGAGEQELARSGVGEVGAAHDLSDPLSGVVDDHGEVVGGGSIAAADAGCGPCGADEAARISARVQKQA